MPFDTLPFPSTRKYFKCFCHLNVAKWEIMQVFIKYLLKAIKHKKAGFLPNIQTLHQLGIGNRCQPLNNSNCPGQDIIISVGPMFSLNSLSNETLIQREKNWRQLTLVKLMISTHHYKGRQQVIDPLQSYDFYLIFSGMKSLYNTS